MLGESPALGVVASSFCRLHGFFAIAELEISKHLMAMGLLRKEVMVIGQDMRFVDSRRLIRSWDGQHVSQPRVGLGEEHLSRPSLCRIQNTIVAHHRWATTILSSFGLNERSTRSIQMREKHDVTPQSGEISLLLQQSLTEA